MTFKNICEEIVVKLNNGNIPKNKLDRYELECWFPCCKRYQAVIYHHGGRCTDKDYGMILWTNALDMCNTQEEAYKSVVKQYLKKFLNVDIMFESYEEMMIKLAIQGMDLEEVLK